MEEDHPVVAYIMATPLLLYGNGVGEACFFLGQGDREWGILGR